jgi:hypothetical protein
VEVLHFQRRATHQYSLKVGEGSGPEFGLGMVAAGEGLSTFDSPIDVFGAVAQAVPSRVPPSTGSAHHLARNINPLPQSFINRNNLFVSVTQVLLAVRVSRQ